MGEISTNFPQIFQMSFFLMRRPPSALSSCTKVGLLHDTGTSREKAWQLPSIRCNLNGTCREGKSKNLFARSPYKYSYLDCGAASFFDFGQNKVPFKKYIHFASIFGILSSKLFRLCLKRGLGPLQIFHDMLHIITVEQQLVKLKNKQSAVCQFKENLKENTKQTL